MRVVEETGGQGGMSKEESGGIKAAVMDGSFDLKGESVVCE